MVGESNRKSGSLGPGNIVGSIVSEKGDFLKIHVNIYQ